MYAYHIEKAIAIMIGVQAPSPSTLMGRPEHR